VTLTLWFPTKREFAATQPKANFASIWVTVQDQNDARYKQSRVGRMGEEEWEQHEGHSAICREKQFCGA
jgi:hypothetical protein